MLIANSDTPGGKMTVESVAVLLAVLISVTGVVSVTTLFWGEVALGATATVTLIGG